MKTKTPPGPSIHKWSSKPADHNAARVRNNQRRHRARARDHVQDLERRLEETSARLEAALQTIGQLEQEVEVLRRGHVPATPTWPQLHPAAMLPGPEEVMAVDVDAQQQQQQPAADPTPVPHIYYSETPPTAEPTNMPDTAASPPPPPPTGDDKTSADCGCDDGGLPPQAPGESTLPCGAAFRIIEQQSLGGGGGGGGGVEVTTVRAWLGPGFRRALRPGGACRVETGRVYELLDHVTSST